MNRLGRHAVVLNCFRIQEVVFVKINLVVRYRNLLSYGT